MDIAEMFWPYDGPHNAESVTTAAYQLARLARYLANATGRGNGLRSLEFPSTVDSITGNLGAAAGSLCQVLGQLADRIGHAGFAADPRLYDDRAPAAHGVSAGMATHVAINAAAKLRIAQGDAHQLIKALQEASRSTNHLGLSEPAEVEPAEVDPA